ncbi:hypothetical protein ACIGNX_28470 [Actinosynnema sp. NPDC053489]|uniref:hypothetical protein n=1 Tax=Actinosynnema sp. NPDC053489 TaxID=3363916 RepID=UPI0037C6BE6C
MSGHRILPEAARAHAEREIRDLLDRRSGPVIGMTSLAEGADQLFARLVLEAGGTLHAVIPARDYDTTFSGAGLTGYRQLLAVANEVVELDFDRSDEPAYLAAGHFVVEHCELLVAVWDGQPARGPGGTADAVARARELGRDVLVTWPSGVRRT